MKRAPSYDTEIFERGVEHIITHKELETRLAQKKQLRIKHGIDATAPGLHLGHAASLWKIRALQEAGHCAVILLGDVTTTIGDPTGRSKARPALSEKEIASNARAIEKEASTILLTGRGQLEFHRSSEWYKKMALPKFLSLLAHVTHARLIERDMFQVRIQSGNEIFVSELIYPILQGYDSVMLNADLTIIGSDQLFNEHMGRFLQERLGQPPQVIVALAILPGLDGGEKMSKSAGNFIALSDSPENKFGKAMRVPDSLIIPYLTMYTDVPSAEIKKMETALSRHGNPMAAKLFFAEVLVRRYHGTPIARRERERFIARFSRKEVPDDPPVVTCSRPPKDIVELLLHSGLVVSKSEGRRVIQQGGVKIDGVVARDIDLVIPGGKTVMVQVGKRRLAKVIIPPWPRS